MNKLKDTIGRISGRDRKLMKAAACRLDNLTKPPGSLGRLENLAMEIVGMTGAENPSLERKTIFTLAADHGVVEEGVSAFPQEVTAQMVMNFLAGGAAINVLSDHIGARVIIADVGVVADLGQRPGLIVRKVGRGTRNMAKEAAMSRQEAIASIATGIGIFEDEMERGVDIAGIGEMGIGNTTAASAITAVVTGQPVEEVTGHGTGVDEIGWQHKVGVIKKALAVNSPDPHSLLDVLAKVGGFEIGGLAGIILGAAARRVPVMVDGFISGSAALIAVGLAPQAADFLIASHRSVEQGHKVILDYLKLEPLLDLNMRLGEGTGAALGIGIAEASVKILTQMATFDSAGVSNKE